MYEVKADLERKGEKLVAVASTAVVDRQGEIVSVEGWDLKNFNNNPIMLWAHDHTIPAIGVAKNTRVEGAGGNARLIFEPEFHTITEEARAIKQMFDEKILNSFSVGFRPLDMEGNKYTSQELLEISAVNVPANPEARTLAYKSLQKAGFEEEVIKGVVGVIDEEAKTEDKGVKELLDRVEAVEHEVKVLRDQSSQKAVESPYERQKKHKAIDKIAGKLLSEVTDEKQRLLLKALDRLNESMLRDNKKEL